MKYPLVAVCGMVRGLLLSDRCLTIHFMHRKQELWNEEVKNKAKFGVGWDVDQDMENDLDIFSCIFM